MARTTTLLERARAHSPRRNPKKPVQPQEIDLALAWLQDEIHLGQVSAAYGGEGTANTLYRIAVCLREAHRKGQLQVAA